jgi:hypothetical protein
LGGFVEEDGLIAASTESVGLVLGYGVTVGNFVLEGDWFFGTGIVAAHHSHELPWIFEQVSEGFVKIWI